MIISFEIPAEIEREISSDGTNMNHDAKEAYLVDLYQRRKISHSQVGEALGLSRYETDGVLKRRGAGLHFSIDEMRAQAEWLHGALLRSSLG